MIEAVLVGVGGAVGATARYLVGTLVQPADAPVPVDTLTVNVVGSFVLGLVPALGADSRVVLLVGVGACGAFTTFSSFSVDTLRLWENGRSTLAVFYAVSNLLLATGAVATARLLVGPA